jgi:hypothetical protein
MLAVRSIAIVKNRVKHIEIRCIRNQPRVDIRRLDRHGAAVVLGSGDFRKWLMGDDREREHIRLMH